MFGWLLYKLLAKHISFKNIVYSILVFMKNTLLVIIGPTGVGKTELCLRIAEHFRIPIINADSRQLFRELPIGTAAPTPEQQQRVKHYFVGNLSLGDYYSASRYEEDVMDFLSGYFSSDRKLALMTGGSMMYIDSVCNGIDDIPTIDDKTRQWMKDRYTTEGLEPLCAELEKLDPEYYSIVDKKNPKRVVHALEICHMTGKTYTSFRKNKIKERPFDIIKIGLNREREELYERINKRVDEMVGSGLEKEAREVYPFRHLNSLNTVGYKELFEYFDGKCTLDEAVFRIKCDSRKYCRKQLTWFRRDPQIKWFHPDNIEEIIKYIETMIYI